MINRENYAKLNNFWYLIDQKGRNPRILEENKFKFLGIDQGNISLLNEIVNTDNINFTYKGEGNEFISKIEAHLKTWVKKLYQLKKATDNINFTYKGKGNEFQIEAWEKKLYQLKKAIEEKEEQPQQQPQQQPQRENLLQQLKTYQNIILDYVDYGMGDYFNDADIGNLPQSIADEYLTDITKNDEYFYENPEKFNDVFNRSQWFDNFLQQQQPPAPQQQQPPPQAPQQINPNANEFIPQAQQQQPQQQAQQPNVFIPQPQQQPQRENLLQQLKTYQNIILDYVDYGMGDYFNDADIGNLPQSIADEYLTDITKNDEYFYENPEKFNDVFNRSQWFDNFLQQQQPPAPQQQQPPPQAPQQINPNANEFIPQAQQQQPQQQAQQPNVFIPQPQQQPQLNQQQLNQQHLQGQKLYLDFQKFEAENYNLAQCRNDVINYRFYNLRNQIQMSELAKNYNKNEEEIKDLLKNNNFDFVQVEQVLNQQGYGGVGRGRGRGRGGVGRGRGGVGRGRGRGRGGRGRGRGRGAEGKIVIKVPKLY